MTPQTIIGLVLGLIGLSAVVYPRFYLWWTGWKVRVLLGGQFTPGPRTETAFRLLGVFLVVLAVLVFVYYR